MAASVITRDLEECHLRTRHLAQYLATHLSEGLFYRYGEEGEQMDIYGDASFAPGGSASRTGWILCLGSHALTWGSQRQTLIALSTCEAELIAATSAILAAQPMMLLLEEIRRQVRATLRCDNAAAIAIVRKEELSLRNRHLSIRAEYLRDLPENVSISYTSTGEQKADVLTKGLARGLHQKAIRDIGTLDSAMRVGVGRIERSESEGYGDTSENAISALAFATTNGQLGRVQRSSLIYHPSLASSLQVDQLERVQRSSQIEDATRQCCDPFLPLSQHILRRVPPKELVGRQFCLTNFLRRVPPRELWRRVPPRKLLGRWRRVPPRELLGRWRTVPWEEFLGRQFCLRDSFLRTRAFEAILWIQHLSERLQSSRYRCYDDDYDNRFGSIPGPLRSFPCHSHRLGIGW